MHPKRIHELHAQAFPSQSQGLRSPVKIHVIRGVKVGVTIGHPRPAGWEVLMYTDVSNNNIMCIRCNWAWLRPSITWLQICCALLSLTRTRGPFLPMRELHDWCKETDAFPPKFSSFPAGISRAGYELFSCSENKTAMAASGSVRTGKPPANMKPSTKARAKTFTQSPDQSLPIAACAQDELPQQPDRPPTCDNLPMSCQRCPDHGLQRESTHTVGGKRAHGNTLLYLFSGQWALRIHFPQHISL